MPSDMMMRTFLARLFCDSDLYGSASHLNVTAFTSVRSCQVNFLYGQGENARQQDLSE